MKEPELQRPRNITTKSKSGVRPGGGGCDEPNVEAHVQQLTKTRPGTTRQNQLKEGCHRKIRTVTSAPNLGRLPMWALTTATCVFSHAQPGQHSSMLTQGGVVHRIPAQRQRQFTPCWVGSQQRVGHKKTTRARSASMWIASCSVALAPQAPRASQSRTGRRQTKSRLQQHYHHTRMFTVSLAAQYE